MAKPGVKAFSELAALSSKQHGLMTHEQVMAAGLNRMALSRLVRSGEWQRLRPRVFRRFAKSQTDEQALMAVCLSMGEGVVLSHRSAAKVLGLALEQGDLEVTTSAPQRPMKGVIVHRSGVLEEVDVKVVRSFPITAGARTIIDLASCLNEQELAIAVEEAWRKRIAVPEAVSNRLSELRVQGRQIGALDAIIADCSSRSRPLESALEVVVWRLIKGKDLPTPILAWEFEDDVGQPFRVDFAFPAHELAIECDGWETHGGRDAFESDRLRTQRLAALGWRVMMVTWKQVTEEPHKFLSLLRQALTTRSNSRPLQMSHKKHKLAP